GMGCSATFGPLMADVSHWFARRRGIAVSIAAASNYIAGTFWPTVIQHFIATDGWRATHIGIGIILLVTMLPPRLRRAGKQACRSRRQRCKRCCALPAFAAA